MIFRSNGVSHFLQHPWVPKLTSDVWTMGLLQHPCWEQPIIATSVGIIVPKIGVVWMFCLEAMSVGTVLFAETEAGEYQEGYTRGRWEWWL